jgi:hypothetical protein
MSYLVECAVRLVCGSMPSIRGDGTGGGRTIGTSGGAELAGEAIKDSDTNPDSINVFDGSSLHFQSSGMLERRVLPGFAARTSEGRVLV